MESEFFFWSEREWGGDFFNKRDRRVPVRRFFLLSP